MDQWKGKIAVVTGASSGIGAAIAKSLAKKGIIVIGVARREEKIKDIAKLIEGKIHPKKCDLLDEKQIIDLFKWIATTFNTIDILVNSAGVCKIASLLDGATKDWKTTLDVNVLGLSIVTREALLLMRKHNKGHIIHINSIAGHVVPKFPDIPVGMYSASKYAVTALSEALRVELQALKSKIKVTCISPGSVYTELVRDLAKVKTADEDENENAPLPHGFLRTDDVVDAVVYALSTPPYSQIHDISVQAFGQAL